MAAALSRKDLDDRIKSEKDWRHQYSTHLDQLVESLFAVKDVSLLQRVLHTGLEKVRGMEFESSDGKILPLSQAVAAPTSKYQTIKVHGTGTPKTSFELPYKGQKLTGSALEAQCDQWSNGPMEPDAASAIKSGSQQLAALQGRTFLVLGANSELGPLRPLLEAGATVAAVATKRPKRWKELLAFARQSAGTLLVPCPAGQEVNNDEDLAAVAGADLVSETPQVVEWLLRCGRAADGQVTLGTYLYADGEANVRLTAASDYAVEALKSLGKEKVSFAYLASCSTSQSIPQEAVKAQEVNFQASGQWSKTFGKRQVCTPLDGSRCFLRAFEVLQGPNYALAQLTRQWRAALLHSEGFLVSSPLAPMCRTESVVHNPTMAVVLEGVAHFPPQEAYDPDAGRMAMFAILLSDLTEPVPELASPMLITTRKAFHSGIWRTPFVMASLGKTTWFLGKVAPKKAP
ncbi:unnamed protein product [Effrenium voratum]|uniref:Uncharacterized protein n=1 Tax=Effrenium voratum TaxID=2562239 RepID=A0AA36IVA0_9DINO|nr:unnamed protein product [Effrenium voratum]CAJ1434468.1 unnamed protein product [Effrenium voratum]